MNGAGRRVEVVEQLQRRRCCSEFVSRWSLMYSVPEKVSHLMFDNKFGKCGPIFNFFTG